MEDIRQMEKRHKKEVEELMNNCKHIEISDCMPFAWAPGHISHCVKVCKFCSKTMFTTFAGIRSFDENGKEIIINETPKGKLFICPQKEGCFYLTKKEKTL